jgi:hypothetical protein
VRRLHINIQAKSETRHDAATSCLVGYQLANLHRQIHTNKFCEKLRVGKAPTNLHTSDEVSTVYSLHVFHRLRSIRNQGFCKLLAFKLRKSPWPRHNFGPAIVARYDGDALLSASHIRRQLLYQLLELVIFEVAGAAASAAAITKPVTSVENESQRVPQAIIIKPRTGSTGDSSCIQGNKVFLYFW